MSNKNYSGEGSKYQRKDGRWEWRYRYNGKIKSLYAKSKKELNKKIDVYLSELQEGQQTKYSKMNLAEFVELYLDIFKKQSIKNSTYDLYKDSIRLYLRHSSVDVNLEMLNTFILQKFFNEFSLKMSYETVKRIKGLLNQSLQFGFLNGYIKSNPMSSVVMPKRNNCNKDLSRPAKFLNEDETKHLYKLIITKTDDIRLKTLITLLQYSGLRVGEALALKWSDVEISDIENSYVNISKTIKRINTPNGSCKTEIRSDITKTLSGTRMVPIPNHIAQSLNDYKTYQEQSIQNSYSLYDDMNIIFTTKTGNYLDSQNVQKMFKRFLKANNFRTDISFHSLRHSYASLLINRNENLKVVSELLGHRNITTTVDKYGHLFTKKKMDTVKKLNLL